MRTYNLVLVAGLIATMVSCQKEENPSIDLVLNDMANARGGGGSTPDISTGLIAYYPFNGNANEAGGNFNGTVYGATLTKDRFGKRSRAYSFDGIDDFIFVSKIDQSYFDGMDFTISVWVLFRNFNADYPHIMWGDNGFLVFQGNGTSHPFAAEKVGFYLNQESTPYATQNGNVGTYSPVSKNQWHNITVTKLSGQVRIYIDGDLSNTGIFYSNGLSLVKGTGIYFGTAKDPARFAFNLDGNLDDIRIYNRALAQDQIIYLATR